MADPDCSSPLDTTSPDDRHGNGTPGPARDHGTGPAPAPAPARPVREPAPARSAAPVTAAVAAAWAAARRRRRPGGHGARAAAARPRRRRQRRTRHQRHANGSGGTGRQRPDAQPPPPVKSERRADQLQPEPDDRELHPRAARRPELRHLAVHDPAVPAADLPGLRNPVRDPVGGPRRHQPDRDRASAPTSTSRPPARSAGCSSCRPPGRRTASTPTATARPTPTTPSTRSAPRRATSRRRAATTTSARRSSPTTTRLVRRRGPALRAPVRELPEDLLGSLTGLTQGDRFPVAANARYADDIVDRQASKRAKPRKGVTGNVADVSKLTHTSRDQHLRSQGRSGGRRQRRRDQAAGSQQAARQLHRPPGRLREPLHLRPARQGREALSGAEGGAPQRGRPQVSRSPSTTRRPPRRRPRASRSG